MWKKKKTFRLLSFFVWTNTQDKTRQDKMMMTVVMQQWQSRRIRRVLLLTLLLLSSSSISLHGCSSSSRHRCYHYRTEAAFSTPAPTTTSVSFRRSSRRRGRSSSSSSSENLFVSSGRVERRRYTATGYISSLLTANERQQTESCSSFSSSSSSRSDGGYDVDEEILDQKLLHIVRNLQLNILTDAVTGDEILSFQPRDPTRYAIEVIQTQISISNGEGLGLVLTEMASTESESSPSATANDNRGHGGQRGLVVVSEVSGNAQRAHPKAIKVGDVITSVRTTTTKTNRSTNGSDLDVFRRTAGLNYDGTVQAIGEVKQQASITDGVLVLELNRLVERVPIRVEIVRIDDDDGKKKTTMHTTRTINALAGENLRQLLMRKVDITLGVCGGEGTCGSCVVKVHDGVEFLSGSEADMNRRKGNADKEEYDGDGTIKDNDHTSSSPSPSSVLRKACQTTLGVNNQPGTVRIEL